MKGTRRFVVDAISVVTIIALAITFIACGFAVCAEIPPITKTLTRTYGNEMRSPFNTDELVQAAVATRAYTVDDNDYDKLMDVIALVNDEAETPWAGADIDELAEAGEQYVLTPDAISHLDDVYYVIVRARYILCAIAILAICGVLLTWRLGKRGISTVLLGSGIAVCAVFVVIGAWAVADFDGFFSIFHMLFFTSGSWVFSADSLLICMYPDGFWMGMGVIWLSVSIVLSILSIIIGAVLRHRRRVRQA